MSNFPSLLKEARAAAGLTQAEVASKANLTPAHVSHFETGERLPCLENLKALCLALNVSADRLLEIADPEKTAFMLHVGASSFKEATEVLLRTKQQDEEKIEEMHNKIKELGAWKESALQVMPDMQKIGELLDVRLGDSVHDKIVPGIEALNAQIESLTQSPAPSKEMEEKIEQITEKVWLECYENHGTLNFKDYLKSALNSLAAELGKEREADKPLYIMNAETGEVSLVDPSGVDTSAQDATDRQIEELKRELAEAQKVQHRLREADKTSANRISELNRKLLALSAAYQRQKEALTTVIASAFPNKRDHPAMYAAWKQVEAALAETPDVILERWRKVFGGLVDTIFATEVKQSTKNANASFIDTRDWNSGILGAATEARTLLSTLQPDHQK